MFLFGKSEESLRFKVVAMFEVNHSFPFLIKDSSEIFLLGHILSLCPSYFVTCLFCFFKCLHPLNDVIRACWILW